MADTFTQTIDVFLNLEGPQWPAQFFPSRMSSGSAKLQFVQGDTVLLRLWPCLSRSGYAQPAPLRRVNGAIVFAVKKAFGDTTFLAYADSFALVDSSAVGDGSEEHYEAELNLNTVALAEAFSGVQSQLDARLDIELQSPLNARRMTFAATVQIVRQAYQGDEVPPVDGQPVPPAPGSLVTLAEVDGLVDGKVSALVPPAVAAAVGSIPRITDAQVEGYGPEAEPTVELVAEDPNQPQNLTLKLGIPRGTPGMNGVVSVVPPSFQSGSYVLPTGSLVGTIFFPEPFLTENYQLSATIVAHRPSSADPAPSASLTLMIRYKTQISFEYELSDLPPVADGPWVIDWTASGATASGGGSGGDGGSSGGSVGVIQPATGTTLGSVILGAGLGWDKQYPDGQPAWGDGAKVRVTQRMVVGRVAIGPEVLAPQAPVFEAFSLLLGAGLSSDEINRIGPDFVLTVTPTGVFVGRMPRYYLWASDWGSPLGCRVGLDWTGVDTSQMGVGSQYWSGQGFTWMASWSAAAQTVTPANS